MVDDEHDCVHVEKNLSKRGVQYGFDLKVNRSIDEGRK